MHPSRFREELKRFDKQLDFVWNGAESVWEIVGTDRKNVKYLIKRFPLGTVDSVGLHTLKELYDCSPLKQGGTKNLNRRIDELIEEEEKAEERDMQNAFDERMEDAWVHFKYKVGERVSLHNSNAEESSFMVVDKRRIHLDAVQ